MLKNNYHTHMKYCNHAVGETEDYVKKAIELGMSELGMSDHAPIPVNHGMTEEEWKENYCYENMTLDTFSRYLGEIDELRKKYKNIVIYKGLESEYLDNNDDWYRLLRNQLDYMILGIHFYQYNGKTMDTYTDINYSNIDSYYENAKKAIESGLFDYFAHPDIYYFGYKDKNGNHVFDEKCKEICLKLIHLCVEHHIYFEINTNGVKYADDKKDRKNWKYPNEEFFKIVKNYMDENPGKLKLVIGADAHEPEALANQNVAAVLQMIQDLGLKTEEKIDIRR